MFLCFDKLHPSLRDMIRDTKCELGFFEDPSGIVIEAQPSDSFSVIKTGNEAKISYTRKSEVFLGLRYIVQENGDFERMLSPSISNMSLMCDCSRGAVMNKESVKKMIRLLALCGYQSLMLYTEDTYEVYGEPYFGYMRGRYSKDELKELDAYAIDFGITLIPCIQTLAHLNGIVRWGHQYGSIVDNADILMVGEERTYTLIENMFKSISECFTHRCVNVGMDEAWLLGAGKYLGKNGYVKRTEIMKKHLARVLEIAEKYGFDIAIWSDMFFRPLSSDNNYYNTEPIPESVYESVPKGVKLIYWDYYKIDKGSYLTHLDRHLSFGNEIWFAGSTFTNFRFTCDRKKAEATMLPAIEACMEKGIQTFLVTQWGDDGCECSMFSSLPTLIKLAAMNYGEDDESREKGMVALTGLTSEEFNSIDIPKDRYLLYNDAFAGIYDTSVEDGYIENYKKYEKAILAAEKKATDFAYLFRMRYEYCRVMELKYDLGVKTREYYQNGNKEALRLLVKSSYRPLVRRLKKFYEAYAIQWFTENKPFGIEIQDLRTGGLIFRINACADRLTKYADGKCESIPELEEMLLDIDGRSIHGKRMIKYNVKHTQNVSVNMF